MLFDHPLVMVGGDRGQTLRQQIVHRVAALHFDDVALLADVIDGLDQQQLDAVVLAAREPLARVRLAVDFALAMTDPRES